MLTTMPGYCLFKKKFMPGRMNDYLTTGSGEAKKKIMKDQFVKW